jgi:RimJ/RimL family protein N-acetyltransferase
MIRILPATMHHAKFLFDVRNDPETVRQSKNQSEVKWDEHVSWLEKTITDPNRQLYTAFAGNSPVGTGRIDFEGWESCEISVAVAPRFRGMGYASEIIAALKKATDGREKVRAVIRVGNEASIRAFIKNGFVTKHRDFEFLEMEWQSES